MQQRNCPAAGCTDCNLWTGRQWVVWGEGAETADIMLVGEAPGYHEDITGRPFVGRAGKLLDQLLVKAGLARGEVYITNTVKCRPEGNRDPLPREMEACSQWLQQETETVRPRVIVALGKVAMKIAFPGEKRLPAGVARSMELYGQPVVVLATYHPAKGLYEGEASNGNGPVCQAIVRDLRRARRYAQADVSFVSEADEPAVDR